MRMHWLSGGVVLAAALALVGCGNPPTPEMVDDAHLANSIDENISEWLNKPRLRSG